MNNNKCVLNKSCPSGYYRKDLEKIAAHCGMSEEQIASSNMHTLCSSVSEREFFPAAKDLPCKLTPRLCKSTKYSRRDMLDLTDRCGVDMSDIPGYHSRARICQELHNASLPGSPCNLTKTCPHGYRRADLVRIANKCNININHHNGTKKNMGELCVNIQDHFDTRHITEEEYENYSLSQLFPSHIIDEEELLPPYIIEEEEELLPAHIIDEEEDDSKPLSQLFPSYMSEDESSESSSDSSESYVNTYNESVFTEELYNSIPVVKPTEFIYVPVAETIENEIIRKLVQSDKSPSSQYPKPKLSQNHVSTISYDHNDMFREDLDYGKQDIDYYNVLISKLQSNFSSFISKNDTVYSNYNFDTQKDTIRDKIYKKLKVCKYKRSDKIYTGYISTQIWLIYMQYLPDEMNNRTLSTELIHMIENTVKFINTSV